MAAKSLQWKGGESVDYVAKKIKEMPLNVGDVIMGTETNISLEARKVLMSDLENEENFRCFQMQAVVSQNRNWLEHRWSLFPGNGKK